MKPITKQMQTAKNKKPKVKRVSKNKPTAHEKEYLEWLQEQDVECFACNESNNIEWHHVKRSSSDKKIHTSLIPLCGDKCHRLGRFSAHGNPSWFRNEFPMDKQKEHADTFYYQFLVERDFK